MNCGFRRTSCAIFLAFLGGSRLSADAVKLYGKPAFEDVRIVGFEAGRLEFRGLSRQVLRKPLAEVEWFAIDELPILEQAERPVGAEGSSAVAAYERAIADAHVPWLERLLRVRQVRALDLAGRFDEAVAAYLKLLGERLAGIESVRPRRPATPGDPLNLRARELIETALAFGRYRAFEADLQRLRLELLLWDDVEPLPEPFAAPERSDEPRRANAETGELAGADLPPPMFGEAPLESDEGVRLPADSFVLTAAEEMIAAGQIDAACELMKRARRFVADDAREAWAAALDRCRTEHGERR